MRRNDSNYVMQSTENKAPFFFAGIINRPSFASDAKTSQAASTLINDSPPYRDLARQKLINRQSRSIVTCHFDATLGGFAIRDRAAVKVALSLRHDNRHFQSV